MLSRTQISMITSVYQQYGWAIKLLVIYLMLGLLMSPSGAQTDDNAAGQVKKVRVVLRGVEKDLLDNVKGTLELWAFNEAKIPSVARLRFMHQNATEQIKQALRPFGYYRPVVESELLDLGVRWQAVYRIDPRDRVVIASDPVISLGDVVADCSDFRYTPFNRKSLMPDIKVQDEEFNKHKQLVLDFCAARETAALKKGSALNQQAYDALKQSLQSAASRLGYFDAVFSKHEIRIDLKAYNAEIFLQMEPGERYRTGAAELNEDKQWITPDLLERFVDLEDREYFDAGKLQSLQTDLTNAEYYKRVEVRAAVPEAEQRVVPVKVDLTHIPAREYVAGIGYDTDEGLRFKLGVTGRRVNSRGHHYNAEARVSEIGYGLAGAYTIPTGDPRTDSFGFSVRLDRSDTTEKDSRSVGLGANYKFRDGFWFKNYSLEYQVERFGLSGESNRSTLLMPGLEWTRTYPAELEKRINTVNGTWLQFSLRGASDSLVSDTSFIQPKISTKWIRSFENKHRFIARATAATTWVKDYDKLPLTLRYYTGGDSSIRGYDFEQISPLNEENEPQGGRHLLNAGLEYEIPFRDNYSVAVFSDIGDAFNDEPDYRRSMGIGLRWRSPIGPVRFDLARSLNAPGKGNVKFHLSLGPDL